jgi:hypothetical protein
VGVIYNPILDELYTAWRGGGAYLNYKRIAVAGNKVRGREGRRHGPGPHGITDRWSRNGGCLGASTSCVSLSLLPAPHLQLLDRHMSLCGPLIRWRVSWRCGALLYHNRGWGTRCW